MKQYAKRASLLVGVVLVVGMLVFFNFHRAFVKNELVRLDLLPQPEKLTELYFNNSANLPTSIANNQAIHFAFVIHNLETTDYQYVYEVSVNAHDRRHIVDSGKVLVRDNQYYVKNEKVNLMNLTGPQDVVVELTNKQQSIDFWIRR